MERFKFSSINTPKPTVKPPVDTKKLDESIIAKRVLDRMPTHEAELKAIHQRLANLESIKATPVPTTEDVIGELKSKQYLEPKDIKGMPIDMRWHGGGASRLSQMSDVTFTTLVGSQVLTYNASTAKWVNSPSQGGSGSGITSINSDTTAGQTLVTGTSGTNFVITDGGAGVHTFNIPTASAVNRGLLSSTDWTTFNNKGSGNGTVTSVSVTSSNGVSGSVATSTTTPAITLTLGAITPTTVNGNTIVTGTGSISLGTGNLTVTGTSSISGTAYVVGGTDVALADGGTGASLVDPNADRIFFWDDSAGSTAFLALGTGLSISGTTITATGVGITWNEVTGTSGSASVNNGYILNNAGVVTLTLPSTAAVGDVVRVAGKGAGGWSVAQNAGQSINLGVQVTTTGTGGSIASTNRYDALEILCITANSVFTIISSQGNPLVT